MESASSTNGRRAPASSSAPPIAGAISLRFPEDPDLNGTFNSHSGLRLRAPRYVTLLDAATGKLVELRAVNPGEFGQKHAKGEVIGAYDMLPGRRTPDQIHALRAQLEVAYDDLLPLFAADQTGGPREIKETAAAFRSLFSLLVEQPLLPYYAAVGKVYFAWLDKLAA